MNLKCEKIEILEKGEKKYKIKFLDSDIVMPIDKSVVESKIKNGFYKVVVVN